MYRLRFVLAPLLLIAGCTSEPRMLPPGGGGGGGPTPGSTLAPATTLLGQSDTPMAHATLEPAVAAGSASADELALSAITYLMNVNQTCDSAGLLFSNLNITLDVAHDIFGERGFFARADRDTTRTAEDWFESQVANSANGPTVFEREGVVYQDILDAFAPLKPCLTEAAKRLDSAFTKAGTKADDIQVKLPAGLLFADADVILQAPELRLLQGAMELAVAGHSMLDAFDWSWAPDDPDIWVEHGMNRASAERTVQAKADLLNEKLFALQANGARILADERSAVKRAVEHILDAILRGQRATTDATGVFEMARLDPIAMAIVVEIAESIVAAVDGNATVPHSDAGTTWSLAKVFAGSWQDPDYEPWVVEEDNFAFYLTSVEGYWVAMVNQFFNVPILDDPGPMGVPAQADALRYTRAESDAMERNQDVWAALRAYVNRNWDNLWDRAR